MAYRVQRVEETGKNVRIVREEIVTVQPGVTYTIDDIDVSKYSKLIVSYRESTGVAHTNSAVMNWKFKHSNGSLMTIGGATTVLASASRTGNQATIDVSGDAGQLVLTNGDTVARSYNIVVWGRI
jgi:hypothetical protein